MEAVPGLEKIIEENKKKRTCEWRGKRVGGSSSGSGSGSGSGNRSKPPMEPYLLHGSDTMASLD